MLCFFNITNAQDWPDYNETVDIYTYHNSSVTALGDPDWDHSSFQKWLIKVQTQLAYNNIDYLGEATYTYNCHFYGWFKTENYSGVNYWVNDPSKNWDDYSFPRVSSETYAGKVTYNDYTGTATHSAVTTSSTGRYKSKWGSGCLWEHDWDECPYTVGTARRYYERLKISGPTNVCTSNSTFSLANLPPGVSTTWSVVPSNRVSPSSGTGSSAVFSGSCSNIGKATVTFAISAAGTTGYNSKDFNSCGPDPADIELEMRYTDGSLAPKSGSVYLQCPNTHYHITLINTTGCSASSLSWTLPTGWSVNYQYSNMISIYTNSSPGGQVILKGQTCCSACGSNVTLLTQYFGIYYSCGGYYMASPNPGSDFIDINVAQEASSLKSAPIDRDIMVTVYNNTGSVVHSASINGFPYRIDTSELPIGSYLIRIIDGKTNETIRILVDH